MVISPSINANPCPLFALASFQESNVAAVPSNSAVNPGAGDRRSRLGQDAGGEQIRRPPRERYTREHRIRRAERRVYGRACNITIRGVVNTAELFGNRGGHVRPHE